VNTLEMRRLRQEMILNAKALIDRADAEKRGLTEEENGKLQEWRAEAERMKAEIELRDSIDGLASEVRATTEPTRPEVQAAPLWGDTPAPAQRTREEIEHRTGQYMQAVMRSARPGASVDPIVAREQRAATGLGEAIPTDGGFLVGTDIAAELYRRAYTMGQITSRCRRVPISTGANSIKINGIEETSRATGSRYGGVRAYWLAEAGAITPSRPKFRQIELNLHKLGVLVYATDELLQDAQALGSMVLDMAAEEIMWATENTVINGTGVGQPAGVLGANCLVDVDKEVGQAATTFVAQNAMKMWSRMWAPSRANAAWYINQDVEPQLFQMYVAAGTGGVPVYLPANGLSGSPYGTLFGRPVIPVEYCPTLGTIGDVILADFGQYFLADKGGVQSASSIHVQFLYDETVFRFVYRVDGQPAWHSELTPASGSTNTLSPFVALDTRS
jgi:HK97 family phage major capsid protein